MTEPTPSAIETFKDQMQAAGITSDKPLYPVLLTVYGAALKVDTKAEDIGKAVRASLSGLRPAYERRWHWHRWATAIVSCVVCLSAFGAAEAFVVGRIYYALGSAESARWSAWCSNSANISADGKTCLVPISAPR